MTPLEIASPVSMDQSDPHSPQSQSDWAVKATSIGLNGFFPSQSDFYFNSTLLTTSSCRIAGEVTPSCTRSTAVKRTQFSHPDPASASHLPRLSSCLFLLLGVRSSVTDHCTPCGSDQFSVCVRSFGIRLPTCMYDPPLRSDDLKCICTSCVLGVVIIPFVFTRDVSV